jgi:glutathionylspermidine synthase
MLPGKFFFTCTHESDEDFITVKYLQDLAQQAGIETDFLYINEIGVDDRELFATTKGELLRNIFKLYPWEWMFGEEFGGFLILNQLGMNWVEPPYKAILSNKMLLPYLYQLFPDSPYILPCAYDKPLWGDYVRKPVFSREGANVTIFKNGIPVQETNGSYGDEGFIYQQYFPIPTYKGYTPVIGSWLIGGEPAGIGIRESNSLITDNKSLFCPHYFLT